MPALRHVIVVFMYVLYISSRGFFQDIMIMGSITTLNYNGREADICMYNVMVSYVDAHAVQACMQHDRGVQLGVCGVWSPLVLHSPDC